MSAINIDVSVLFVIIQIIALFLYGNIYPVVAYVVDILVVNDEDIANDILEPVPVTDKFKIVTFPDELDMSMEILLLAIRIALYIDEL